MIEHLPSQACIVGAGAAGGLIARRLVDAGLQVVLLEALVGPRAATRGLRTVRAQVYLRRHSQTFQIRDV